ncbi:7303_t:CDS:2, partial [Dentiscutata heterogama]
GETKAKLNNDPGSCCCNGFLYYITMGCGLSWLVGGMNRSDIRARHNIEGSCLGDHCTHCCCCLCALVQEHREVHTN